MASHQTAKVGDIRVSCQYLLNVSENSHHPFFSLVTTDPHYMYPTFTVKALLTARSCRKLINPQGCNYLLAKIRAAKYPIICTSIPEQNINIGVYMQVFPKQTSAFYHRKGNQSENFGLIFCHRILSTSRPRFYEKSTLTF